MTNGRAVIEIETDNEYTLLVYKQVDGGDDIIQSATSNQTLTAAFNGARDALAAMIGPTEKARRIVINVRIT